MLLFRIRALAYICRIVSKQTEIAPWKHKEGFETLFNDHYESLVAYACSFVEEYDAAEELVQEVYFKLWTQRDKVNIKSTVRGYLYSMVRNASLNLIKHLKITEEYKNDNKLSIEQFEQQVSDAAELSDLQKKIKRSINALPLQRKKIFLMSRYDGLKYQQIADELGISIRTVEKQMSAALKFMRTELGEFLMLAVFFFNGN